jgi:hypothetical protein
LKPDMIGPGVNILAAWTGVAGPTGLAKDGRRTRFNIISGEWRTVPHQGLQIQKNCTVSTMLLQCSDSKISRVRCSDSKFHMLLSCC